MMNLLRSHYREEQCKFFVWADEHSNELRSGGGGGGGGRGGKLSGLFLRFYIDLKNERSLRNEKKLIF